jgi:hypothetical protein
MAGSTPQPTHELDYILLVEGQHILVLKALGGEADTVFVSIDEVLASHLIGVQDLDVRPE